MEVWNWKRQKCHIEEMIWILNATTDFYSTKQVFGTAQIFLVTDILFAHVKREFYLFNGYKSIKPTMPGNDDESRLILKWLKKSFYLEMKNFFWFLCHNSKVLKFIWFFFPQNIINGCSLIWLSAFAFSFPTSVHLFHLMANRNNKLITKFFGWLKKYDRKNLQYL